MNGTSTSSGGAPNNNQGSASTTSSASQKKLTEREMYQQSMDREDRRMAEELEMTAREKQASEERAERELQGELERATREKLELEVHAERELQEQIAQKTAAENAVKRGAALAHLASCERSGCAFCAAAAAKPGVSGHADGLVCEPELGCDKCTQPTLGVVVTAALDDAVVHARTTRLQAAGFWEARTSTATEVHALYTDAATVIHLAVARYSAGQSLAMVCYELGLIYSASAAVLLEVGADGEESETSSSEESRESSDAKALVAADAGLKAIIACRTRESDPLHQQLLHQRKEAQHRVEFATRAAGLRSTAGEASEKAVLIDDDVNANENENIDAAPPQSIPLPDTFVPKEDLHKLQQHHAAEIRGYKTTARQIGEELDDAMSELAEASTRSKEEVGKVHQLMHTMEAQLASETNRADNLAKELEELRMTLSRAGKSHHYETVEVEEKMHALERVQTDLLEENGSLSRNAILLKTEIMELEQENKELMAIGAALEDERGDVAEADPAFSEAMYRENEMLRAQLDETEEEMEDLQAEVAVYRRMEEDEMEKQGSSNLEMTLNKADAMKRATQAVRATPTQKSMREQAKIFEAHQEIRRLTGELEQARVEMSKLIEETQLAKTGGRTARFKILVSQQLTKLGYTVGW
jgi:hypothetical protein